MALMFYLIYKITNTVNGKIYVGSHKTRDQNDGYLGSGKYLKHAFDKHGIDKFVKEILFVYDNAKEMYAKEAEIVNDEFLAEENTYNLKRGGFGGFDFINENGKQNKRSFTLDDSIKGATKSALRPTEVISECNKKSWSKIDKETRTKYTAPARAKCRTEAANAARKATYNANKHQQGENNSQFGTCWVTDGVKDKKIKKTDLDYHLLNGFSRGRKKLLGE
jgi:hypothetical protein